MPASSCSPQRSSADHPATADVAEAARAGDLSVGAASAIRTGLGAPGPTVSADDLLDAAKVLVTEAASLTPEKTLSRAREMRDELDTAVVAEREAALREKRFLRLTPQADGMTRLFGMLDPESAALVTSAVDLVTSPRRGGPRFVDSEERARAGDLVVDSRTTEQIAVDALVDMVRIAAAADPGRVFGAHKPGVRVVIDARDLGRGFGVAHLEGQSSPVSVQTAERVACTSGYLTVVHESDGALDVGRAQRLFTERQRVALAVIWGGCAAEGCDRPPAWTEAHHIEHWNRGGATDVSNGILLCRHHHLLLHNNGWRIVRGDQEARESVDGETRQPEWRMLPPVGDRVARPVRLVSKNPIGRSLLVRQ